MSHSPTNYMDGVPVKISEKYKPPPKLSLPQKIVHCLAHCSALHNDPASSSKTYDQYDFHLERHTQQSLSSWKNVRQQERFARKERIRQRMVDRQRQLDEHQKQMLTAVSYPSTEDLSSDEEHDTSPDESSTVTETRTLTPPVEVASASATQTQEPQMHFDTILKPTIMAGQPKPDSYWSFSNQLASVASNKLSADIASRYTSSSAFAQINYSDFENDTSSPFDNVELKTIDDLDILAQVLKQNYVSSKADSDVADEVTTDNPTINQNHAEPIEIADTSKLPLITSQVSISRPFNENVLNSNGEVASRAQPIANHSSGYYSSSSPITYAQHHYYDNQNQHLAYSMSPDQKHAINAPTVQHVYISYPNQTHANHHHQQVDTNTSCNQMYASAYGGHVPQYASHLGPDATGASAPIHTNTVPDILRQLKTSSGNALH